MAIFQIGVDHDKLHQKTAGLTSVASFIGQIKIKGNSFIFVYFNLTFS